MTYNQVDLQDAIAPFKFKRHGDLASYHYADDSGNSWMKGDVEKAKAMALFMVHPELRGKMTSIAEGFLWSLPMELGRHVERSKVLEKYINREMPKSKNQSKNR